MKKFLTIFMMSCLLFGSPNETLSDSSSQLTSTIKTFSNGGEGDVGPPHAVHRNEKINS